MSSYAKSIKLVMSLGFHPQIDSFNYELFDVDRFRLHVMDCVGALICLQKVFNKFQEPDDVVDAKRRLFWQSLTQVSALAENEFQIRNEALSTVLQSSPDEQNVDEKQCLPLHFAVALEKLNLGDINSIFVSNPESIQAGSDSRLINPCHLFSMSYTKPILIISHQLKIPDSHLGQFITYDGSTPLHLAARHSNSAALIKELIQIHPPALRKLNRDGKTPICLVFENTTSMAPNILREFLQADRELIEIGNKENCNEPPIH